MGFLTPLVSRLSIATKNRGVSLLHPNWAQEIVLEELEASLLARQPLRLVGLKARQLGFSTIMQAFIYVMGFAIPNLRSMVIADEDDNARHLLSMQHLFWATDPFAPFYKTKYQAKNTLHWVETASQVETQTAGNKHAGRSRTVDMLHASEVAFWRDPKKVMSGLLQAIPYQPRTLIVLESTANGVGNYFNGEWVSAVAGETNFTPLFFPWWMHPEYRASHIGIPHRDLNPLDEEEKALLVLFKEGLRVRDRHFQIPPSEWDDALMWRRYAIANFCQGDINIFHQEYPSTPEEAFIATGTNVFPIEALTKVYAPMNGRKGQLVRDGAAVKFVESLTGPLTIFKYPSPDADYGHYLVGGDATETMAGDYACGQVINRRTLEQVAIWRGRITPAHFGEELAKLGIYYNSAIISSENEGPGYATIGALIQMEYPNLYQSTMPENLPGRTPDKFGWSSSYKTKSLAIGWTLKLVVDGQLLIHDRATFDEMTKYVRLDSGEYGNADQETGHDDTVMALAIGVTSSVFAGPVPVYGQMSNVDEPPVWENWTSPQEEYA